MKDYKCYNMCLAETHSDSCHYQTEMIRTLSFSDVYMHLVVLSTFYKYLFFFRTRASLIISFKCAKDNADTQIKRAYSYVQTCFILYSVVINKDTEIQVRK